MSADEPSAFTTGAAAGAAVWRGRRSRLLERNGRLRLPEQGVFDFPQPPKNNKSRQSAEEHGRAISSAADFPKIKFREFYFRDGFHRSTLLPVSLHVREDAVTVWRAFYWRGNRLSRIWSHRHSCRCEVFFANQKNLHRQECRSYSSRLAQFAEHQLRNFLQRLEHSRRFVDRFIASIISSPLRWSFSFNSSTEGMCGRSRLFRVAASTGMVSKERFYCSFKCSCRLSSVSRFASIDHLSSCESATKPQLHRRPSRLIFG